MALRRVAHPPQWTPIVPPVAAAAAPRFGIAMIAVLWTNDAWYCVTWIAGEMKQPQRDLPRALLSASRC